MAYFCFEQNVGSVMKNTWYILWSGCDEELMAYFLVKCVEWLCIRIYGIFCSEQNVGSVMKNTWYILW